MYIVFDIGATNMRVAASIDGFTLINNTTVPTPQNFDEAMGVLSELAKKLAGQDKIQAMAGGVAGNLSKDKSRIVHCPNLPNWVNQSFKETIEQTCKTTLYLENDAALEGLGEAVQGAGKEYNIVAYITVGTGVGGVRIVNKKIDSNSIGFEPGHQIIDQGKTLEFFVSGTGLQKQYGATLAELSQPQLEKWMLDLAYGLNNIIVCWSPNIIVLGGGVIMNNTNYSLPTITQQVEKICVLKSKIPLITLAKLPEQNGLLGALAYANQ